MNPSACVARPDHTLSDWLAVVATRALLLGLLLRTVRRPRRGGP